MDLIWMLVAFFLTLMVFSYLLGDNPLFRIAVNAFVGTAAGYVCVMVVYEVFLHRLVPGLITGNVNSRILTLVPWVLGILLLFKLIPPLSRLGNLSMAYLVGAGAGVAIGGAVMGTLFGQIGATLQLFTPQGDITILLEGFFMLLGTISTLVYFQFSARGSQKNNRPVGRGVVLETLAGIGKIFIAVTLGALFAGVYVAAITALIERLDFLKTAISSFLNL